DGQRVPDRAGRPRRQRGRGHPGLGRRRSRGRGRGRALVTALVPGTTPARWVDDDESLREVVAAAAAAPRHALATEFHRERSYYPRLALVQVAWEDQLALVDPLGVDVRELVPLFAGPGVAVLHAAQQDLDVLTHACGAVPARLADTQLMAGFLGHSTP